MDIRLINQPFGPPYGACVGSELISAFMGENFTSNHCKILVAFAKRSATAVLQLREAIQNFIETGGTIQAVIGIDFRGTSIQVLQDLLDLNVEIRVFRNPGFTFHPKLYLFENEDNGIMILGSSNFTFGGLFTNHELSVRIKTNLPEEIDDFKHFKNSFDNYFNPNGPFTENQSKRLTYELLEQISTDTNLLVDEDTERGQQRTSISSTNGLFEHLTPHIIFRQFDIESQSRDDTQELRDHSRKKCLAFKLVNSDIYHDRNRTGLTIPVEAITYFGISNASDTPLQLQLRIVETGEILKKHIKWYPQNSTYRLDNRNITTNASRGSILRFERALETLEYDYSVSTLNAHSTARIQAYSNLNHEVPSSLPIPQRKRWGTYD